MSVVNNSAYGTRNPIFGVQQKPIISPNDPTTAQTAQIGTLWINKTSGAMFILVAVIAGFAAWENLAINGGAGSFTSLTVNPGNLTVTAGNIVATAGSISAGTTVTAGTNLVTTDGNALINNIDNSAVGPAVDLQKSRAGAIVHNADSLGSVSFSGWDGTGFKLGAGIAATADGTIGAGRMPADLNFFTAPDAVSAALLRMFIPAHGGLVIEAPTIGAPLQLPGPINIYTGAGDPNGVITVTNIGDFYINTTATMATDRLYIATDTVGTFTNIACAA